VRTIHLFTNVIGGFLLSSWCIWAWSGRSCDKTWGFIGSWILVNYLPIPLYFDPENRITRKILKDTNPSPGINDNVTRDDVSGAHPPIYQGSEILMTSQLSTSQVTSCDVVWVLFRTLSDLGDLINNEWITYCIEIKDLLVINIKTGEPGRRSHNWDILDVPSLLIWIIYKWTLNKRIARQVFKTL